MVNNPFVADIIIGGLREGYVADAYIDTIHPNAAPSEVGAWTLYQSILILGQYPELKDSLPRTTRVVQFEWLEVSERRRRMQPLGDYEIK